MSVPERWHERHMAALGDYFGEPDPLVPQPAHRAGDGGASAAVRGPAGPQSERQRAMLRVRVGLEWAYAAGYEEGSNQVDLLMRDEDAVVTRGDERQAQALVDLLRSVLHPEHVWREELNARWVVFVRHEEQTYCLLPLQYEAVVVG